jgi:cytochrome c-type biogenesis protein CcmH/NrfF
MNKILFFCTLLILFSNFNAQSFEIEENSLTYYQNVRAEKLFTQIKCMVCKGEGLSSSNSLHAKAMRSKIRNYIKNGLSDTQILTEIEEIYGSKAIAKINKNNYFILIFLSIILFLLGIVALKKINI